MSKFIDFPAVRFNIQKQINNQIDVKMQELQSKPLTPSSHLDVYAFHAVDEVLRNIVTEEGIAELISGRKKLVEKSKDCELKDFGGNLKAITVGNKPEETGDLDVDMEYGDDFDSFDVTLSEKSNPAEKVTVTLSREGFFFWQVTNVLLPFKPVAGS